MQLIGDLEIGKYPKLNAKIELKLIIEWRRKRIPHLSITLIMQDGADQSCVHHDSRKSPYLHMYSLEQGEFSLATEYTTCMFLCIRLMHVVKTHTSHPLQIGKNVEIK